MLSQLLKADRKSDDTSTGKGFDEDVRLTR